MPRSVRLLLAAVTVLAAGSALPASAGEGDPIIGTFSIVAFDAQTGELGVAVQSRAFNVGAGVAWARAGVGAIATQSYTNESFGPRGLALLRSGRSAVETLEELLATDEGRERRQVGIVDAEGRPASFTGSECMDWAGGIAEDGIAAQGNILASEKVVTDLFETFRETEGELSVRLLAALQAAQAAGGDKRGQQSAALLVVRPSAEYPEYEERYVHLRVDDDPAPIDELERLYRIHEATDGLEAHLRYHEQYASEGRSGAAARELERVGASLRRALDDPDATASMLNGLAWYTCTNDVFLEQALEAAMRAHELDPESVEILDTLAECQFRSGDREAAVRTITEALARAPGDGYLEGQKRRFESE